MFRGWLKLGVGRLVSVEDFRISRFGLVVQSRLWLGSKDDPLRQDFSPAPVFSPESHSLLAMPKLASNCKEELFEIMSLKAYKVVSIAERPRVYNS